MKILLTGFEPFGGSPLNPSASVVEALASDTPADIELATMVLPVIGVEAGDRVVERVESDSPDAVVMLGEATGRPGVSIEQIAINLRDYRMSDNAGNCTTDEPVVEGGPDAYFASLPVRRLVESIRDIGVPASRSLTAGAFLCNEISYRRAARQRDLEPTNPRRLRSPPPPARAMPGRGHAACKHGPGSPDRRGPHDPPDAVRVNHPSSSRVRRPAGPAISRLFSWKRGSHQNFWGLSVIFPVTTCVPHRIPRAMRR